MGTRIRRTNEQIKQAVLNALKESDQVADVLEKADVKFEKLKSLASELNYVITDNTIIKSTEPSPMVAISSPITKTKEKNKNISKETWDKYLTNDLISGLEKGVKKEDTTLAKWIKELANPTEDTYIKVDPKDGAAFFALVQGQESSGGFSGLSFTVFPIENQENPDQALYAVTLNVGTQDYGNDYHLAHSPGIRRMWKNFLNKYQVLCTEHDNVKFRIKSSLTDKESDIDNSDNIPSSYRSTTLAYAVIDYNDEKGRLLMLGFFAQYAEMRKWGKTHEFGRRKKIFETMNALVHSFSPAQEQKDTDFETVNQLVHSRRFVVLQGAPGTGKTHLAKKIAEGHKVFFTQFHAETSYSDFVYGIQPNLQNNKENSDLSFKGKEGIFLDAIRYARKKENKNKEVYLIIDEINRANLASVLGPAFYLFEYNLKDDSIDDDSSSANATDHTETDAKIELAPGYAIKGLPSNLFVIATMNTADRSLAVVDFALRRRFAWYTMVPHKISFEESSDKYFAEDYFNRISEIFDRYATDEELNLKPGHAYFIVEKPSTNNPQISVEEKAKDRLRYEVMPLIKEYLAEGILAEAQNDFYQFFLDELGEEMFQ